MSSFKTRKEGRTDGCGASPTRQVIDGRLQSLYRKRAKPSASADRAAGLDEGNEEAMIGETIAFVLSQSACPLFVAAIVLALSLRAGTFVESLFAWILLLPVGVTGLWAGATRVFFPATAAAHIGWQVSPPSSSDRRKGPASRFGRTSRSGGRPLRRFHPPAR
jgi:hypothetical protein